MNIYIRDTKGRIAKGNHPLNEYKKGAIPWNKNKHMEKDYPSPIGMTGRQHTDEWKEEASKNRKNEKHWNWKDGISRSREHKNEQQKKWYYEKPNKKLHNQKRQCLKKNGGKLTIKTIQRVYENNIIKYGTLTCIYCLQPIQFRKDHLEHKQPLSRGGTNRYENLGIACQKCNCTKHTKTEKEYRKMLAGGSF